mmetsp:Transcript_56581/g.166121  ORF Transcript_56581/g.166121 Transcript_56581/m.166121 type:complete len:372 (+) Transcript_56581:231-1346(+)
MLTPAVHFRRNSSRTFGFERGMTLTSIFMVLFVGGGNALWRQRRRRLSNDQIVFAYGISTTRMVGRSASFSFSCCKSLVVSSILRPSWKAAAMLSWLNLMSWSSTRWVPLLCAPSTSSDKEPSESSCSSCSLACRSCWSWRSLSSSCRRFSASSACISASWAACAPRVSCSKATCSSFMRNSRCQRSASESFAPTASLRAASSSQRESMAACTSRSLCLTASSSWRRIPATSAACSFRSLAVSAARSSACCRCSRRCSSSRAALSPCSLSASRCQRARCSACSASRRRKAASRLARASTLASNALRRSCIPRSFAAAFRAWSACCLAKNDIRSPSLRACCSCFMRETSLFCMSQKAERASSCEETSAAGAS